MCWRAGRIARDESVRWVGDAHDSVSKHDKQANEELGNAGPVPIKISGKQTTARISRPVRDGYGNSMHADGLVRCTGQRTDLKIE